MNICYVFIFYEMKWVKKFFFCGVLCDDGFIKFMYFWYVGWKISCVSWNINCEVEWMVVMFYEFV